MRGRLAAIIILALTFLTLAMHTGHASTAVEKLMMPGLLSDAHVKLEEDCANCHKVLQKAAHPACASPATKTSRKILTPNQASTAIV
jgi:hypothetical protein